MDDDTRRRSIDDLLREARAALERLTPLQARDAAARGGLIVDIRSEAQRAEQGLVAGAHFVPRNVLEWRADPASAHRDPALQGPDPLVLMCAQGFQSSLAAATLRELGVTGATDMAGGFEAWVADGLPVEGAPSAAGHWDGVFAERGPDRVSWYEASPRMSLEMIGLCRTGPDEPVIDVGGGASELPRALLERGFADVTVLDLSAVALATAREALGADRERVRWIVADALGWVPDRAYALWHDRAVLHFLVDPGARGGYLATARAALRPGGHLVVGAFAPDGPEACSGLPVARHDAGALVAAAGPGFRRIAARRDEHRTPRGTPQPFTWVALRRTG